jgi:hypothetical protein
MPKLAAALTGNPEVKFFRVLDSESPQPDGWELEPLQTELLSDTESDGLHVMKACNILPDHSIRDCHMDIFLPERISDYAFFLEKESFRFGYRHQFPGEIIPAAAIDCFGLYDLFYSRISPEVGINVLKRGLAIAKRKRCIAEDLGYIFRDEKRFREAAEMFKIAVDEGPSSSFICRELAAVYAELGNTEDEKKYMEMCKRTESQQVAQHARLRRVTPPIAVALRPRHPIVRWFLSLFQRPRKDQPAWPVSQTHKGKALAVILKDCGKPSKDLSGYYKHRSQQPCQELPKGTPPGPHRTLIFRRIHGILYVWLHQERDSWICFQLFWLPDRWLL